MRRGGPRARIFEFGAVAALSLGLGLVLGSIIERTPTGAGSGSSSPPVGNGPHLRGTVVLDGATQGCGGDPALFYVKDGADDVAHAVVDGANFGADCVYRFDLSVPDLPCYALYVNDVAVGGYPREYLTASDHDVGYIDASSVFGGQAYRDFPSCAFQET
ncbi:MAG: hypothetical protein WD096_02585 [Actinomycetota bacterium]